MIHTDKKILSLSMALLLCFGTLALAAPPAGKGGGKGNKEIDATASFAGEITSSTLQGVFVDNGDFDTLAGQLAGSEFITVIGDAGGALENLAASKLPAAGIVVGEREVSFDVASGVSWTIRLDRDKYPLNRVQFKMRWVNAAGLEHHLRIGWVVQGYEDEVYPLPPSEYGEVPTGVASLASTTITFATDFFRVDGKVPTGRGKKTELEVFSKYGEIYSVSTPWCNMGISADPYPELALCVASTTILTALN